ncbi:efflux RND transporter periplasmic adaptor subunit [Limnohabitans sp. Bal53]|uniref:efflux RND transporter periplasmic adaptor subunit n=1 Tax=Limnohabitans sp. Bal53 TaxID=1977910 RepID=UPI001304D3D0|nr:efflux RND transporter periplasmic adaptor subunit [Limnohabitans sp. Bal53]
MNVVWTWIRPRIAQLFWGLLFLFLGAAALRWWVGPLVQTEAVQRRDLLQTVVASGRVETPHRVDMGAQITGTVARVPVAEGQSVKAGDVLIELVSTELESAQRQAEQAVMQAKGRLRQLTDLQGPVAQQMLRQAQAGLDAARASGQRSLALFEQGFIGQAALDESRKALTLAEAQVLAAQKQVASTQTGGAEHSLAVGAVAEAQANAEGVRAKARYAVIQAPVSGQLIGRSVEVGDVVQAGKVLMTLSPEGATQLVVQIDEKNLRLIALGQQALASADAYPQQKFKAQVAYINPGINAQTGAVEVKLDVTEPQPNLRQDMTVSVDLVVARKAQVLALQVGHVNDINGAAPWVWLRDACHAVRRPLRLGLRGGAWVEVLDGLREGDAVILVPEGLSNALRQGQRVRAPS